MDVIGPDSVAMPGAEVLVREVIAPLAEQIDGTGVPRSSIDALAGAGLLGTPLPPAEQREVGEVIAMADASTWFCWVQHQSALRAADEAAPALRERWFADLSSGAALGAVAFAHVRRPGPPNPVARRVDGGWRVAGTLDWVTSWDIADVCMVMVADADLGDFVRFLLPIEAMPLPGMVIGDPLRLLAMSGTHTRPITLDDVLVPDALVADVIDADEWRRTDAVRTKDANPAIFGLVRGAVAELAALDQPAARPLVDALVEECRDVRRRAYALADIADASNGDARLALRAHALDLAVRATTAVVIARSGAAMRSGTSAERRVREAMFLQVQAQTAESRVAGLNRLLSADR